MSLPDADPKFLIGNPGPALMHATGENRERWLELLSEAAAVLLTAEDPDSMLHGLFDRIARQLNVDTYFNFMVDPSGKELRLMSCIGVTAEQAKGLEHLQFGQAICGTVAQERRPIVATHIQSSTYEKAQTVRAFGIRAYACNPLLANGEVLGTLSFASRTRDEFDAQELEFIETITRYVTAAYERLRLIEELQAADRRKDEFLATVSHELRTPLASGYGWVQFLEQDQDPDVVVAGLRAIKESFRSQIALVDDLLDVSRIAAGKLELHLGAVDFADVVHDASEAVRDSAAAKRITLSISLQPRIPVRGDPARLRQVVLNLVNNAVKFTPEGGEVSVDLRQHDREAELVVRDSGIGIDPSFLPHVFEPFRQGDSSMSRQYGGLGLGLSLVASLVAAHGGDVQASSPGVGQGATFDVRLPLADGTVPTKTAARVPAVPLFLVRKQANR